MKTLILTGWGWKDYACAAAAALRALPDAGVLGCSTRRLPEKLRELLEPTCERLEKIVILGIGWRGDPEDLLSLVKALRDREISVSWLSMLPLPEWLPGEFQHLVECMVNEDSDYLTSWVAETYHVYADDLLQLVKADAQRTRDSEMARKLLMIDSAMYFYRTYQDSDAYGKAVRTLAEKRPLSSEQHEMIAHFEQYDARELVGISPAIVNLRELIERVGPKDYARVIIRGETGTGKETVALQLHFKSPRSREAFIATNCATMSQQLLISQLFGHEKGAFTGAVSGKPGHFEAADGGTLFLDEVGELPPEAQAGLLRVLQDGRFCRLGSNKEIKVDVRVIAATNRDLPEMVAQHKFREDLFHRLNMVQIHVPPLREHPEDISIIANAFWMKRHRKRLSAKQISALENHNWPGNVRELHNVLNQADILEDEDFEKLIVQNRQSWRTDQVETRENDVLPENLDEMIRRHTRRILTKYNGNVSHAANAMGITRNTLKKYRDELD